MAVFGKKTRWVETSRLRSHPGGGRTFVSILFWLWGLGGLVTTGAAFGGLGESVGVGTSAYLTAGILFWIGGMLLFGIGALLANNDFAAVRRVEEEDHGDVRVTR